MAILHDPNDPTANLWPTRERTITLEEAKKGTDGKVVNRHALQNSTL